MLTIDMPLEKLLQYQGVNPRPADFDTYWEESLRELDAQDLSYTLEKETAFEAPGVECYHLYFTGVGGARIHSRLLKPLRRDASGVGKFPGVCLFHGYNGNAGDWYSKLPFAQSGMVIAAMDVRGQFGLSDDCSITAGATVKGQIIRGVDDDDPKKLFFRSVFLDTAQLARVLMSMDFVDETRIGAYGGSQGGALTLACASLEPRVKKILTCYPFLCDYKRVYEMDLISQNAYAEIGHYFRQKDPRHERENRFFERLGYIDLQYLAPRIRAEVLMLTGLMDTTCPPSTQFAAYNKIKAPKKYLLYPEYGHEALPQFDELAYSMMRGL